MAGRRPCLGMPLTALVALLLEFRPLLAASVSGPAALSEEASFVVTSLGDVRGEDDPARALSNSQEGVDANGGAGARMMRRGDRGDTGMSSRSALQLGESEEEDVPKDFSLLEESAESRPKSKSQTKSDGGVPPTSFFLAGHGSECPPGAWRVEDVDVCRAAVAELAKLGKGKAWSKEFRAENKPGGCFENTHTGVVSFNRALHGKGSDNHTARICKTSFFLKENTNSCPESAAEVGDEDLCKQAMHALRRGPWEGSIASDGRDDRPGACAMNEGGIFYFNPSRGAAHLHTSKVCMTRFFRKMNKNECPEDSGEITDEYLCKEAMVALKLGPWHKPNTVDGPGGCYADKRGRISINLHAGRTTFGMGKICMTASNRSLSSGPNAAVTGTFKMELATPEQANLFSSSRGAVDAICEALANMTGTMRENVTAHLKLSPDDGMTWIKADYKVRIPGSSGQSAAINVLTDAHAELDEAINVTLTRHSAKVHIISIIADTVPYVRTPEPAKYWCGNGVPSNSRKGQRACCAESCGACVGDDTCGDAPGGSDNCCIQNILKVNRKCTSMDDVVCTMPIATPPPTWPSLTPDTSHEIDCHASYADHNLCCGAEGTAPNLEDDHHCTSSTPHCVGYKAETATAQMAYGKCQVEPAAPTPKPTPTPTKEPTVLESPAPAPEFFPIRPVRKKRITPPPTPPPPPPELPGKTDFYLVVTPWPISRKGGRNVSKIGVFNDGDVPVELGWRDYAGGHAPEGDQVIPPHRYRSIDTNTAHVWVLSESGGHTLATFRFKVACASKIVSVSMIARAGRTGGCGHAFIVSGGPKTLAPYMGKFESMDPDPGLVLGKALKEALGERPIYHNKEEKMYLYYWSAKKAWGMDRSFDHEPTGIMSNASEDTRNSTLKCPNGGSSWTGPRFKGGEIVLGTSKPYPKVMVQEVCHKRMYVKSKDKHGTQEKSLGWYNMTDLPTDAKHGHRQIFKNNNGVYLYYLEHLHSWRLGPAYTKAEATIKSGATDAQCPNRASGWEVWIGNNWSANHSVYVRTGVHSPSHTAELAKKERANVRKQIRGKRQKGKHGAHKKSTTHKIKRCKAETGLSCKSGGDCGNWGDCIEGECLCKSGFCVEGGKCKKDEVAAAGLVFESETVFEMTRSSLLQSLMDVLYYAVPCVLIVGLVFMLSPCWKKQLDALDEEHRREAYAAFDAFDGKVDITEAAAGLARFGLPAPSPERLKAWDQDGSGYIDFAQFEQMIAEVETEDRKQ